MRLFRVCRRFVPVTRGREAVCSGDVEGHQIQGRLLEFGSLWTLWLGVVGMADSVVEKHPFGGGWAIIGFGVVYR